MNAILLVEDDPAITNLLSLHLGAPAYQVTACDKIATALERLKARPYDLVILDILLPDGNGVDLCRRIREVNNQTPILMLSALADEVDKVRALELGADDYLTKPFGVAELTARVKALLRRGERQHTGQVLAGAVAGGEAGHGGVVTKPGVAGGAAAAGGVIRSGELVIDRDKRKVTLRGSRLELTPKEFDLLWLLASHPGKTFSRHELLELIWGFAFQEYEHTVTSHINRLRIKIEADLNKPQYILTTWGAGYRFTE
jgi:two-component system, OmpR family, alkaline phosphatase synthesis response regulator PhoP